MFPGLKSWLHALLSALPWVLSFSFVIYKMGTKKRKIPTFSVWVTIKWNIECKELRIAQNPEELLVAMIIITIHAPTIFKALC